MRWFTILGWDGAMPLLLATVPTCVCILFGPHHTLSMLAAMMMPVVTVLIRASVAPTQLAGVGPPFVLRKVVFAMSISLFFVFEMIVNFLSLDRDFDPAPCIVAVGMYVVYLCLVGLALRRKPLSYLVFSQGHTQVDWHSAAKKE